MPESTKTTLLELAARFQTAGEKAFLQRYPNQNHFLLIPPSESGPAPLVWTSSHPTIVKGNTSITKLLNTKLLEYCVPNAVIIPIQKSDRNNQSLITVGRDESADIRLTSKQVSKFHSGFNTVNNRLTIRDLHSTNGTFINEKPMLTCILESASEITFGDVNTVYLNYKDLIELITTYIKNSCIE